MFLIMDETSRGTAALTVAELVEPESLSTTIRLARFLAHVGAPADGAALLEDALSTAETELEPKDQLLVAEMWVLAREFDAAIAALRRAERLDPENGKAAMIMGQMYLHWEQYDEAAETLGRAARLYGEEAPPEVHYLLAVALINLEEYGTARRTLRMLDEKSRYYTKAAALQKFIDAAEKRS